MKLSCLLTVLCIGFATSAQAACLSYTSPATLEGVIVAETLPGAPDFESIAKGDTPEHILVLRIPTPVCVTADPRDKAGFNIGVLKMVDFQLATTQALYPQIKALVGYTVQIKGTLFGAQDGHHHTPVLIGAIEFVKPVTKPGQPQ